jgi:hypothetical protein
VPQRKGLKPLKLVNLEDNFIKISEDSKTKRLEQSHTQSDMFDEVVDVMCKECHELIPYSEVNTHSLTCFKGSIIDKNESENIVEEFEA